MKTKKSLSLLLAVAIAVIYSCIVMVQPSANNIVKAAEASWMWPVPSNTPTASSINQRWDAEHGGLDIGGTRGWNIVASKSGTVLKVLNGNITNYMGYGKGVVINHGDGTYSHYAHMDSTSVNEGQAVSQGQVIGTMGDTGNATGVHLHFAIKSGDQGMYGGAGGSIDNNIDVITYITYKQIFISSGSETLIQKRSEGLFLYGWAYDKESPSTAVKVSVVVGGPYGQAGVDQIDIGSTNEYRNDIPVTGNHGFNKTVKTTYTGVQPVYVYAINGNKMELITSKTLDVGALPEGKFEEISSPCVGTVVVKGYAYDGDNQGYSSDIYVRVGSTETNRNDINGNVMTAKALRTDVNALHNGAWGDYHGFLYTVPTSYTGSQTVEIHALNVGNGYDVSLGKKTITISTAAHTYVDGIVSTKATTASSGSMKHSCSKCGKEETVTIPKISSVTLGATSYTYDGTAKKPSVTVKDANNNTIASSNYSVTYSNNIEAGQATVSVTFSGSKYIGTITKNFTINAASGPIVTPTTAPTAAPTTEPTVAPTVVPTDDPSETQTATPAPTTNPSSGEQQQTPAPTNKPIDNQQIGNKQPVSELQTQIITTAKIKTYKVKNLKKKKVVIKLNAKSSGNGTLMYTNSTAKKLKKFISISKSGKVTLKKGAKKGTYKITIIVSKTDMYNEAKKVVNIKVK